MKMKLKAVGTLVLALLAGSVALKGQGITSSAISGKVSDDSGNGIPEVSVSIVHEPTGSVTTTRTNEAGRYAARGLRVGGPYTVTARSTGWEPRVQTDVYIELSRAYLADFALKESLGDIIDLEAFTVSAADTFLAASAAGSGSVIDEDSILNTPKINRSFSDIARLDPRVSIADGSNGSGQIVALGQNNRTNNIQIDGVKINDQFGLNSDGNPSLANPISIDTIEEISVELTPYDVRQSGFLGASINAVTKSGTNRFSGSAYAFYENEDMRGKNPITGNEDPFDETTWGVTLGGPIIKDKLFFFLSYEELERNISGPTPGFTPDPAALQQVIDFTKSEYGFDPGTFGSEGKVPLQDEKYLAKVDWQINEKHRASVRWAKTEGTQPSFTEFADFSSTQPETNLTSHWYTDTRTNESWVFQLFSQWTDDFQTEVRAGRSDFDSLPFNPNVFPEIRIDDFPGTTQSGEPTTRGELFFGRDDSRHSNELATDVENLSFVADWFRGDHTITVGFDYEKSEFLNVFLQETFAEIEFQGLEGYLADEIDFFDKALGIEGIPLGAESDFADLGIFIQDTWNVSDKLTAAFGLRYDKITADKTQPLNPGRDGQTFEEIFGVDNTNTVDGAELFAPRVSFLYQIDEQTRLRGGAGLFQGRSPWVWVSNTFSNNGVSSTDISEPPSGDNRVDGGGLKGYLENDFDPENPVTFLPADQAVAEGSSQVDVIQDGFDLPAIYKFNLAVEHDFDDSPWTIWMEAIHTETKTALYTQNLNLLEIGTTPDGRNLYNGRPDRGNGITSSYSNIFQLTNSDKGSSDNITLGFKRQKKDNWWMDISYTYGAADDVSNQGSSTASSNFAGNPIYNQNTDELYRGSYETNHRVLMAAGYDLEWSNGLTTQFSLIYDGRSGQNYSLLFDNDYNGDGAAFDNDLFWIPDGPNDPIIHPDSVGIPGMLDYLASIDATPGLAERGAFETSWRNRWDLSIVQELPSTDKFDVIFYLNILNLANLLNNDWGIIEEVPFQTQAVAEGEISDDGRIIYDFRGPPSTSVRDGTFANLSRWRAQAGIKFRF